MTGPRPIGPRPIGLGLVGVGAIARSQHLPVIASDDRFRLIACADRRACDAGVPVFTGLDEMLDGAPGVEAVVLCTPPAARFADARAALAAGRHVLLEKPPGAGLGEVGVLADQAARAGLTLFAAWHSRYAAGVEPARRWLADRRIDAVLIEWREDVRRWHPGQDWIFAPGGFGVFDPGINALSIVTHVLPRPMVLTRSRLHVPENRQAPILAELDFETTGGAPVRAVFDFLKTGDQVWTIRVDTDAGVLELRNGGADLFIDGVPWEGEGDAHAPHGEYARLYDRFAGLIASGRSDVDTAPLAHVADAFLLGERIAAAPFAF